MDEADEEYFGPELPPHMTSQQTIGPKLPQGFVRKDGLFEEDENAIKEFMNQISAKITAGKDREEDYGPMPCENSSENRELLINEIERRASKTKKLLTEGKHVATEVPLKREAWMMELPPELATNLGMSNRRFKMQHNEKASDRSVWTDTPADIERKMKSESSQKPSVADLSSPHEEMIKARDAHHRKMVEEFDKSNNRTKSLLALHAEKMKKKRHRSSSSSSEDSGKHKRKHKHKKNKKSKSKKHKSEKKAEDFAPERRAFDRENDLKISRVMDSSKRQAIIKRSHELVTKFGHGKAHYL